MSSLRHLLVLLVLVAGIVGALALAAWAWLRLSGAIEVVTSREVARHAVTGLLVGLGTLWAIRLLPDLLRLAGPGRGGIQRALNDLCPARPIPLFFFAIRAVFFVVLVGLAVNDLVRAIAAS